MTQAFLSLDDIIDSEEERRANAMDEEEFEEDMEDEDDRGERGGGRGGRGLQPSRRSLQNSTQNATAIEDFNMDVYRDDVEKMSKYLRLFGMFEKFNGKNYTVAKSEVNQNLFSWHGYDNIIQVNSHGQYELKFNLSDAEIQGTADSIKRMDLVKSNYQLRADVSQLKKDAFASCTAAKFGSKCAQMADSLSKAASNMKKWTMYSYNSLTKAQ